MAKTIAQKTAIKKPWIRPKKAKETNKTKSKKNNSGKFFFICDQKFDKK